MQLFLFSARGFSSHSILSNMFLKKGLKFSAIHSITELYEIGESQEGKMGEIYWVILCIPLPREDCSLEYIPECFV